MLKKKMNKKMFLANNKCKINNKKNKIKKKK